MSWIGLRDPAAGQFHPGGLGGTPAGALADEAALLPQGSLLIEFTPPDDQSPCEILSHSATRPWPGAITLTHLGEQCIELRHRQGAAERVFMLDAAWLPDSGPVLIGFSWDAPNRKAVLSAYSPRTERLVAAELVAPFPMGLSEARGLTLDRHARLNPDVAFLAISDQVEPIGPMPSLSGRATVETPDGPRKISDLLPGDTILDQDGEPVQVHWIGTRRVPARGTFAPLVMRAPYHGLDQDLIVSPQQKVRLCGPEVEYSFGTDCVAVAAGLLAGDTTVIAARSGPVVSYCQMVLSRPVAIRVSGAVVEALDIGALTRDPSLLRHSCLRAMPVEVLPSGKAGQVPVLDHHSARALRQFGRFYA